MFRLDENLAKQWLRDKACPVPVSAEARSPDEAARFTRSLARPVYVKALISTGRRGKAGGVIRAQNGEEAALAAKKLLHSVLNGHAVNRVLIEEAIDVSAELFLSFVIHGRNIEMLASSYGGVEVEERVRVHTDELVRVPVDAMRGVNFEAAAEQWRRARVAQDFLPPLAALTVNLYRAFVEADALLLELNPIAITSTGGLSIVGAMMGVDDDALFRHENWLTAAGSESLPANERERRVALIDREIPGGECRYVELDGSIGLLVGGGGAGLYQHDLMLKMGGRPANHSVTPPTGSDNRKLKAVLEAIFDHPNLKGLLVGFNFTQMSHTDIRVRTLIEVLDERGPAAQRLPIVIRLFGAGEDAARAMVMGRRNIHYVPRGTSLKDAVKLIVDLVAPGESCAA